MIDASVISDFKNFDWQEIISKANQLDDLNDRQWRFMKGLVIEYIVEKHSGSDGLTYVGDTHKDYEWKKHSVSVELKSLLSGSMYGKRGDLRKNYSVKLNNSNGTNNKTKLSPNDVADVLLVILNDGAFIVDKNTVIKHSKKCGDGFVVTLNKNVITKITEKIVASKTNTFNIKERIQNAIKQAI